MPALNRIVAILLLTTACTAATRNVRSIQSDMPVEIAIHNDSTTRNLIPVWVDFEGKEVGRGVIEPAKTWHERSYLTHVWRIYAVPFEYSGAPVQTGAQTELVREFVVSPDTPVVVDVE